MPDLVGMRKPIRPSMAWSLFWAALPLRRGASSAREFFACSGFMEYRCFPFRNDYAIEEDASRGIDVLHAVCIVGLQGVLCQLVADCYLTDVVLYFPESRHRVEEGGSVIHVGMETGSRGRPERHRPTLG